MLFIKMCVSLHTEKHESETPNINKQKKVDKSIICNKICTRPKVILL
jgi:hypothetical protein